MNGILGYWIFNNCHRTTTMMMMMSRKVADGWKRNMTNLNYIWAHNLISSSHLISSHHISSHHQPLHISSHLFNLFTIFFSFSSLHSHHIHLISSLRQSKSARRLRGDLRACAPPAAAFLPRFLLPLLTLLVTLLLLLLIASPAYLQVSRCRSAVAGVSCSSHHTFQQLVCGRVKCWVTYNPRLRV